MVNSLKHALELPGSSAMNNQDKCDPDWVGWHVLYGVLIPLNIVVGFSCSKTKHRTSLSVSTGQGADSSTHSTLAPSSKAFVGQGEHARGVQPVSHPVCTPLLCPHTGPPPLGSSPCPRAHPEQGCTSTDRHPDVYELYQAPPEYRIFQGIPSKFVTSVQSIQTLARLVFPQRKSLFSQSCSST